MRDEELLDGLREIINIGSGHGATALSTLLGRPVSIAVPRVWHGTLSEAREAFDGDRTPVFGFRFRVLGDIKGWVLMCVSESSARPILEALWPEGNLSENEELAISGLAETAHIVSGAFLSAMANMMDLVAFQSTPRVERGPHGDIVSGFVDQAGTPGSLFIGIEVEMRVESKVTWEMIFVPLQESIAIFAEKIGEMLG
ncbi:MAG: chemotaxis protein CheC [candidate division WOR-3 bacterium]